MKHDRIVVLGGSGFVGRHLVSALASRDREVVIVTRARDRAKEAFMLPRVEIREADARDPTALTAVTRGADALINLVGILHESRGAGFNDIHVGVTDAAIRACRANRIGRLLQMSSLHAGTDAPSAYLRSKGAAEARVAESGLDWTIFEPSVLFGREDRFLNLFASVSRLMPVIFLAGPSARFQPVYVGDVVNAMVVALDDDATIGQRYRLCGPKVYTLRELVEFAARQVGKRPMIVGLPASIGKLQALVPCLVRRASARDGGHRSDLLVDDCLERSVLELSPRSSVKIYQVGGSVRDELLGLPVKDRDFVVVGSSPEEMIRAGFRPVGRDFPVFLHPETHEEYALARTERKSGRGHQGFVFHADPEVTLDEDLQRRDLTINAIARDASGALIDPYGGRRDLELRMLRHVSPAFGEDPLRVLRVARFAARFGFAIAEETMAMMRGIVSGGELRDLSRERVWTEFAKGLVEERPSRMIEVLRRCGALTEIALELEDLYRGVNESVANGSESPVGRATSAALDRGAASGSPSVIVQFAIASRHLEVDAARSLAARLQTPLDCRDAALGAARYANSLTRATALSAAEWLDLVVRLDGLRRPERLDWLIEVCAAYDEGSSRGEAAGAAHERRNLAHQALATLTAIDFSHMGNKGDVAAQVKQRRLDALERWLEQRAASRA